jgi:hypothetical protein
VFLKEREIEHGMAQTKESSEKVPGVCQTVFLKEREIEHGMAQAKESSSEGENYVCIAL